MLTDPNGMLVTEPTGTTFRFQQTLEFQFQNDGPWRHLVLTALYDIVQLRTGARAAVDAMRLKRETIELEVFERLPDGSIGRSLARYEDFEKALDELSIKGGDLDPAYNCHGYCFGRGDYWIDGDQVATILRSDGFRRATSKSPVAIVVYEANDRIVHTALRYSGNDGFIYMGKAGVRGVEIVESIDQAARDIEFDRISVYEPVPSPKVAPAASADAAHSFATAFNYRYDTHQTNPSRGTQESPKPVTWNLKLA